VDELTFRVSVGRDAQRSDGRNSALPDPRHGLAVAAAWWRDTERERERVIKKNWTREIGVLSR
jgi:hypothetical protein